MTVELLEAARYGPDPDKFPFSPRDGQLKPTPNLYGPLPLIELRFAVVLRPLPIGLGRDGCCCCFGLRLFRMLEKSRISNTFHYMVS